MPTMQTRNPVSSANLMGHPLHPILITLPIGLFVATFLFDLIFWQTGNAAFATGALWLLGAGLIAAALAAVTGLIDFLGDRRIRALGDAWQHAIGNVILVLIQLFSFLSALSLRDERSRAVRAEPLAHCRSHHAVHRLERRRTALPPPCRGLRRKVSAEARRALVLNRWPGNVRELENTLHRAVLLAGGDEIGINGIVTPDGLRLDQAKASAAVTYAAMAAETVTRALVGRTVADVERDLILETLKHCLGNRTHAANILGISIRTLRNKLNEYAGDGVAIPPPGSGEARLAG
jgi:uncharacterized membrane protein/DNA-binding protein Fis